MRQLHAVLLMPADLAVACAERAQTAGIEMRAARVDDLAGLAEALHAPTQLLLCFGTGVIVPRELLGVPELGSLNVHPASPDYPGRDPHHFAVYDGARRYGATMHYMVERVDAGPIVDVEWFEVDPLHAPCDLLARSTAAGLDLLGRLFAGLAGGRRPEAMPGVTWGPRKTTRKMFLDLCRVDSTMSGEEFERRRKAVQAPGYRNLYTEVHGRRFRLEDPQ